MKNRQKVFWSVVLALVFFVIGYVYISRGAGQLPAFFPGYNPGVTAVHTKHGIAAFVVGAVCLVYAWFQSGPKKA